MKYHKDLEVPAEKTESIKLKYIFDRVDKNKELMVGDIICVRNILSTNDKKSNFLSFHLISDEDINLIKSYKLKSGEQIFDIAPGIKARTENDYRSVNTDAIIGDLESDRKIILRVNDKNLCNPAYFVMLGNSITGRRHFNNEFRNMSVYGNGIFEKIMNMKIDLPELDFQDKISGNAQKLVKTTEELHLLQIKKMETLKHLNDCYIDALLKGTLPIKVVAQLMLGIAKSEENSLSNIEDCDTDKNKDKNKNFGLNK